MYLVLCLTYYILIGLFCDHSIMGVPPKKVKRETANGGKKKIVIIELKEIVAHYVLIEWFLCVTYLMTCKF